MAGCIPAAGAPWQHSRPNHSTPNTPSMPSIVTCLLSAQTQGCITQHTAHNRITTKHTPQVRRQSWTERQCWVIGPVRIEQTWFNLSSFQSTTPKFHGDDPTLQSGPQAHSNGHVPLSLNIVEELHAPTAHCKARSWSQAPHQRRTHKHVPKKNCLTVPSPQQSRTPE